MGTKGVLRLELVASGRMAHSAYPELGESAIEKLVEALYRLRTLELPADAVLGKTTYNIGTIQGGVAPNVIPDFASAELMYRLMGGLETTVVAFATDIPSLTAWGRPFLIGPGSVHVAHTEKERISKTELVQAAEIYVKMVTKLQEAG